MGVGGELFDPPERLLAEDDQHDAGHGENVVPPEWQKVEGVRPEADEPADEHDLALS